jgi:protein ImuB
MRDGQPRWIAFRGAHGPIVAASGPWRTSGNWWTNEPWSRDEWDIAMSLSPESVTLYLIYAINRVDAGMWKESTIELR